MTQKKQKPHKGTVLVTGSAGFIGGNFVREFRRRFPRHTVIGVDVKASHNGETRFYRGSVCDRAFLKRIFKKHMPSYVFHFAAVPRVSVSVLHPAETTRENVYGTALLLELSRDFSVSRFIFSSSSSVYGGAKKLPTREDENPPAPKSPYAAQKLSGEILCQTFSSLFPLDTVCLRYFNVYGPGQFGGAPYSTVISAWLDSIYGKNKTKPFLEGDGLQSRDFTYVDDVVNANILAMRAKKRVGGEAFNIGHGSRTQLIAIKKIIERMRGTPLSLSMRPARQGDVRHTHADIGKARRVLGYRPRVSIEEGLHRTIAWYRSLRNKK